MVSRVLATVAALATSVSVSCRPPDGCIPRATRCIENQSQICDADRYWRELANCDRVSIQSGKPFTCRYVDENTPEDGRITGHICVPSDAGVAEGAR